MNTSYNIIIIFILFIITIIAIQLISERTGIEELSGTEKTQTEYSGIDNYKIPSDLNRWPELESMKQVCKKYGYTVNDNDWKSHIDLLVNTIGVPFNVRTETTNDWSIVQYTAFRMVSDRREISYPENKNVWKLVDIQYRAIVGFSRGRIQYGTRYRKEPRLRTETSYKKRWITIYREKPYTYDKKNDNYSDSTQFRFAEYDAFIKQLVDNNITDDKTVSIENTFNNSQQLESFTTIEGLEDKDIKLAKYRESNKKVIMNNIVDTIKNTGYELSNEDFHTFQIQFASKGKSLGEMKQYINTFQKFGINSYVATKTFKAQIYEKLNPKKYNVVEEITLINTYFSKYGLTSVTEFINNDADGGFTSAVKTHNLHNLSISLFPTNENSSNCVMEKMHSISSVNIPTMGMDQATQKYHIDQFFQEFKIKNVSAQEFFNKIYTIYSALKINMSPYNLNQTLHIISALIPSSLIQSFERLNIILNPQNLNMSFNDYVKLINILQPKVGFDKNNIVELWNAFKTYYSTIAYESGSSVDNTVNVDTLAKWFAEVQTYYASNSPLRSDSPNFFSPVNGDFLYFLKNVLIGGLYKMSDIQRDIKIGMSYPKLISTYKNLQTDNAPQKSGFTAMYSDTDTSVSVFDQIYDAFERGVKYIFQLTNGSAIYEGAETISQSDANTLNSFGITSFSDGTLRDLEQILIDNNVSQIDPSKTIWTNIITFTAAMVKIQITNANLRDFIKLMKDFKAQYIPDWYIVLDKLGAIKLTSYSDVSKFITLSTKFGIYYDKNFDLFLRKLTEFGANFASTGLTPFVIFLDDMQTIGYTYNTPQGVEMVNNIIDYFINNKFSIITYSTETKLPLGKCGLPNSSELPAQFCHLLVLALFRYKNNPYYHSMYDIRTPSLFNRIDYCNAMDAMQQAYMLCTGSPSYNGLQSIVSQNITIVIPFFYKEEVDAILSDNEKYSDMENRVKIIHDIADAMNIYAENFNTNGTNTDLFLYSSLSAVLNTFPALSFQYFAEEFKSKCGNGNCAYSVYLDPDYTHCKASTVRKTANYRPNPPVV